MRKGEELKKHFVENLRHENWCLHFDGKTIQKKEYQVVVSKNENKEIRLAVVELANRKGKTIFDGIKAILDEYDLWSSIKMIVSDTTAANTKKGLGAVTLLQNHFAVCKIALHTRFHVMKPGKRKKKLLNSFFQKKVFKDPI